MDYLQKMVIEIELHSVEGIRDCFEHGISANAMLNGKPLIYELISEYKRGPTFRECIKLFVDYGLEFDDKILLAVLMDDAASLDKLLATHSPGSDQLYSLDCAFTALYQAPLLHICAEFDHLASARILVKYGADINARAGVDAHGFGGHTAIFHTVNQHARHGMEVMKYLLTKSADLSITVKGIIWGRGYAWETFVPSVNPISYAMMGLLPQFQRTEKDIYEVVSVLLKAAHNINYFPANVPNRYLQG